MRLRGFALALFLGLGLTACSSTPKMTTAEISNDKSAYTEYAHKRLDQLEDRADDLKPESRKASFNASLRDTRAELRGLEAASEGSWRSYRDRVDASINRMSSTYGLAE